nr:potassium channel family protein [Vibrio natriegens]
MNFDPTCIVDISDECEKQSKFEVAQSSFYFAGVTLTTLGYGDISPVGFGRVIAVLLAVCGLTIIAILIAKISSERQSSLLLLLHTSDVERRMSEFVSQIESYNVLINESRDQNDVDKTYKQIRGLRSLLEAISSYIVFHTNQSLFLEIGTDTAIKALMSKIGDAHEVLVTLDKMAILSEKIETASLSTSKKMMNIEALLLAHNEHKGTDVKNIDIAQLSKRHETLARTQKITLTEAKIAKVNKLLPQTPRSQWPKDLNKTIARKLNISVKMVHKCIEELKKRGLC